MCVYFYVGYFNCSLFNYFALGRGCLVGLLLREFVGIHDADCFEFEFVIFATNLDAGVLGWLRCRFGLNWFVCGVVLLG